MKHDAHPVAVDTIRDDTQKYGLPMSEVRSTGYQCWRTENGTFKDDNNLLDDEDHWTRLTLQL